jgi:hypothetical protein
MTLDEAIQSIEALDDTTAELLAWCDAYLAENLTNSNN